MNWRSLRRPNEYASAAAALMLASAMLVGCNATQQGYDELSWPRTAISSDGTRVTLSQPQPIQWQDGLLEAKAAVSVTAKGGREVVGTVSISAPTTIDRPSATVIARTIKVPALLLQVEETAIPPLRSAIEAALAAGPLVARFDDIFALMSADSFPAFSVGPTPAGAIPAFTTALPSEPLFASVVAGQLEGAVNTSALLLRIPSGDLYLFLGGRWAATESLTAPAWKFVDAGELPPCFTLIPEGSQWAEALVGVVGSVANRRALLAQTLPDEGAVGEDRQTSFPLIGGTSDPGLWWNPWTLCFWPSSSTGDCPPKASSQPPVTAGAHFPLRYDAHAENRFVGLDGRVYAHRTLPTGAAAWFRVNPDGSWSEFTTERSALRNIRADLAARQGAAECARLRSEWLARESGLVASGSSQVCNRLDSMKGVRPLTNHFRSVNQSLALPRDSE